MNARTTNSRAGSAPLDLFGGEPVLPHGLVYQRDFIGAAEESALLVDIERLELRAARYKSYTARRRVMSYGSSYDFGANELRAAPPLAAFLLPLRAKAAAWIGESAEALGDALVAEYAPGTPLGWHRDVPDFERVVGISLGGECRMRFRPYPLRDDKREDVFALTLAPRSAYVLQREVRWRWQHMVPPTRELRYSITFRTRAQRRHD